MNRPLTPSLSPSHGERVAGGRVRGGSWSQCMRKNERGLSMNRPTPDPSREGNSASVPDIDSPPPEGLGVGSWPPIRVPILEVLPPHEPQEHPTSNSEWRRESSLTPAFKVRCWTFNVFPRLRGFNARMFFRGNLSQIVRKRLRG